VTPIRWLKAIWAILSANPRLEVSRDQFLSLDFAPHARLIAYLESHPEPVAADSPNLLPSGAPPGASLLVPLVFEGYLVGLLSLGTPRGSNSYTSDQLMFVATLADEAAAAARIAQLRSRKAVRELTAPRGT
jgi:GAF domain-containing protein